MSATRRYTVQVNQTTWHNKSILFIALLLGEWISTTEFEEFFELKVGQGKASSGGEISYQVWRDA